MALSEELPVFKATYDLLERLIDLAKDLPKFFRYSVGTRMVDLCLDMLAQIYRANMSQNDRTQALTELLIAYRQLLMLLRVVYHTNRAGFETVTLAIYPYDRNLYASRLDDGDAVLLDKAVYEKMLTAFEALTNS